MARKINRPRNKRRKRPIQPFTAVFAVVILLAIGVTTWLMNGTARSTDLASLPPDTYPPPLPPEVQVASDEGAPQTETETAADDADPREELLVPQTAGARAAAERAARQAPEPEATSFAPETSEAPTDPGDVQLAAAVTAADAEQPALDDLDTTRDSAASRNPEIRAAEALIAEDKLIAARTRLNALLGEDLAARDARRVRELLTRLAAETIFSRRAFPNDPLTTLYEVRPGESFARIAPRFNVPYDIVMEMNGGSPSLRVGQKIKVPRGPFHARIHASDFRLDLYLQDTFVRSYRVGLGKDGGTPLGVWRVRERLPNPTYYPPASAEDKRIIPANDPENPLGEHWVALEGIDGAAVGRQGYGIHGTIEPQSIGSAVSLGCVRMHNEDVAFVYSVLQPGKSTVTTQP